MPVEFAVVNMTLQLTVVVIMPERLLKLTKLQTHIFHLFSDCNNYVASTRIIDLNVHEDFLCAS